MTTAHKITAALALALFLLSGWALYGWTREHEARAVLAAQAQDAKDTLAALDTKEKANQAQLAAQLQSFAQMKQTVQTPKEVIKALPIIMPAMPAPVTQVTAAEAKAVTAANLPNDPQLGAGDIIIPAVDAKSFYDAQVDCKANAAKFASCQETVINVTAEKASDDALIKDQAIALKGGTKWHRTLTAGKWLLGGIAVGYAADRIEHK